MTIEVTREQYLQMISALSKQLHAYREEMKRLEASAAFLTEDEYEDLRSYWLGEIGKTLGTLQAIGYLPEGD